MVFGMQDLNKPLDYADENWQYESKKRVGKV